VVQCAAHCTVQQVDCQGDGVAQPAVPEAEPGRGSQRSAGRIWKEPSQFVNIITIRGRILQIRGWLKRLPAQL
jgi:hypothetical protein